MHGKRVTAMVLREMIPGGPILAHSKVACVLFGVLSDWRDANCFTGDGGRITVCTCLFFIRSRGLFLLFGSELS
jgi:hypothetical protein